MVKVLYLTFFESPIRNGIYETQVRQILCGLGRRYAHDLDICHIAILPAIVLGREGISFDTSFVGKSYGDLRKLYLSNHVRASFVFLPLIILKRWKSNIGMPLLGLLITISLPAIIYVVFRRKPTIIHCRSYVSATIAILIRFLFRNTKVIFDPRGFYPEEGVVSGRWSERSVTFKFWKKLERFLCTHSDQVVALSASFADRILLIAKEAKCALIHAGADVDRFKLARPSRHEVRTRLKLKEKTVFVYSGGLGAWHDPELLGRLFAVIVRAFPGALLLVLTGYDQNRLAPILSRAGLGSGDFAIYSVQPQDIPNYLAACDYGLVPATLGSDVGPMNVIAETMIGTKVAEYLATGLPIIVNSNVGGLKWMMDRHRIGIYFDSKDLTGVVQGIQSLLDNYEDCQRECQLVAERFFSLDQAVRSYHQLYSDVSKTQ